MTERLYRMLLGLYPAEYLLEYRELMEQLFRDQLREKTTFGQRLRFFAAVLWDASRSIPVLHMHERKHRMRSLKLHVFALFIVMVLFLGRYELRTDDAGMVVFFTLVFSFVLAYLQPAWMRLWALVGLCVPLAHVVVGPGHYFAIVPPPTPQSWQSLAAITALMIALGLVGSFAGSRLRRALKPSSV